MRALGTATAAKLARPRNFWTARQVGVTPVWSSLDACVWMASLLSLGRDTAISRESQSRPRNDQDWEGRRSDFAKLITNPSSWSSDTRKSLCSTRSSLGCASSKLSSIYSIILIPLRLQIKITTLVIFVKTRGPSIGRRVGP